MKIGHMRAKRTPLEELTSRVVIEAVIETTPGLRDSIRDALDKGAPPKEIRRRFGATRKRHNTTALAVLWIVDEWEREHGLVKADESIDHIQ